MKLSRAHLCYLWRGFGFVDVAQHVRPVLEVNTNLEAQFKHVVSRKVWTTRQKKLWNSETAAKLAVLLYLDDIETHVDNVLSAGAVVPGSWIALEGIAKVTAVQVVVAQVIMASPE